MLDELDAALRAASRVERAEHERRYLKSRLRHYGTPVPAVRAVVRGFRRDHPGIARDSLLAVAVRLWDEPVAAPVHERRLLSALLLQAHPGALTADELGLLERLLRESRTWALVDLLACDVAGPLLGTLPDAASTAVLDRWAVDGDFWVRRGALLAHERAVRAGGGDVERFLRYADAMLDEREFFIRKAIGWVLRSMSRNRPDEVAAWLVPRADRASGVTLREAVRYLSPEQAAAVDARAARRPPRERTAPRGGDHPKV